MASDALHESPDALTQSTIEMHRCIASLIEELLAVDWYQQRAEACTDATLARVLRHHMADEVEHAVMNIEWLRRNDRLFAEQCERFLFTDAPLTEHKAQAEAPAPAVPAASTVGAHGSLGIGGLKSELRETP